MLLRPCISVQSCPSLSVPEARESGDTSVLDEIGKDWEKRRLVVHFLKQSVFARAICQATGLGCSAVCLCKGHMSGNRAWVQSVVVLPSLHWLGMFVSVNAVVV